MLEFKVIEIKDNRGNVTGHTHILVDDEYEEEIE